MFFSQSIQVYDWKYVHGYFKTCSTYLSSKPHATKIKHMDMQIGNKWDWNNVVNNRCTLGTQNGRDIVNTWPLTISTSTAMAGECRD